MSHTASIHSKHIEGKLSIGNYSLSLIKKGVWLYFILLITEGALRKWVLPSLSSPILIIRDPIAIWILIKAHQSRLLRWNISLITITVIGIAAVFLAVLNGHGNIVVALYGARILLIHFPMIFVIGKVFKRNDILKIGIVTLWITIPMTLLLILQFYSPQTSWINRGIGNDFEGAGFSGALGFFRPPTTFSFTVGTHLFYGLVACFVFYFWFHLEKIKRSILILSTISLLIAIPFSISRSLFYEVCISIFFAFISVLIKPKYFTKAIGAGLLIIASFLVLNNFSFFQPASKAFTSRFESANEIEGGVKGTLGDRFLGGMIGPIMNSNDLPFFGYGIGIGTNAGSQLISGKRGFLMAEEEWGRLIDELGLLLGLTVILVRLRITVKMTMRCWKYLRSGETLPWMLLSFSFILILQGQWAQPTILGFSILGAGLTIAAINSSAKKQDKVDTYS